MRLHHLTVSAFGPFAGTEHVDFDALSTAGIFLFTGATGAGKSSVLDAICFGLYGQVPGARQQVRTLRSDHAAPGVRPEVVLEVTLRGRRLRITRSPQWDRPKLRGSGTTLEPAKILVEEAVADGWHSQSTRLDEAGQLIGGLLGLSLAQFCQVVLLPQGQFAEFLRADADKRRDLLESLFDTHRFAAVESWLVGRRQATWRALDELDQTIGQILARVAEAAHADLPEALSPDAAPPWLDGLLGAARETHGEALRLERSAATAAAGASAAAMAAERVSDLQQRAATLQARLRTLQAAQGSHDAAVAELELARQAAPLMPLLAAAGRLQGELEEVRARAATSHAVLAPALVPALAATGTDSGAAGSFPSAALVSRVSRSTRDEAGALRHLLDQEQAVDELTRRTDALQREAVKLATQSDEARRWLADAETRGTTLAAARDEARAADAGLVETQAASDRAGARVIAAAQRDELATEVAAAHDRVRALTDAHQAARDELQGIRAARLAGMAAELASGLLAGHDCPVCGSVEHPRLASAAELVTPEHEEDAARRAAAAEAERRAGERALGALEVRLAEHRSAAGGEATVASLRQDYDALRAVAGQTSRTAAARPEAERALLAFGQDRETWMRSQVSLEEKARSIAAQVGEQQQRAASLLEGLRAARGDDPTVSARAQRLLRLADGLDGLADHLSGVERLEREVASALERAEAAVRERGFPSVDEVASAARDETQLVALDEARQRHDTEQAMVGEQLAEAELVAAAARPAPDVEALTRSATVAEGERDDAVARAAAAGERVLALERLTAGLSAALTERAPLAAAHRVADGLSRLAEGKSGDNRLRMSLSAYVLAARLEQVAVSASQRLLRMSSGRYSLLHTAQGGSGRARGGLALRVLDAWTGQERDPATLSGGEGFSASLALALGLADVVTSEAGGTLLETLFVDEGFGSLDDETLDEVMVVLDELRDGGRTVGIVSHVADLRQRIPTQLRVGKSRHGSTLHQ